MPIQTLALQGYRSIRKVTLELGALNVIVGPNGCGKSNLYKAVRLLAEAAQGRLSAALAAAGRHPHPGAGARRSRPGGRVADHHRDRR